MESDSFLKQDIDFILSTIPIREQIALRMRYGLTTYCREYKFREIGVVLNVSVERARQICYKGLRYLRHPTRRHDMDKYLNDFK